MTLPATILAVVQNGRLGYEAALLALSWARAHPKGGPRLVLAEPQPGRLWPTDPRLPAGPLRDLILSTGAEILPFESRHFGAAYPYGNKIEALEVLPEGAPFLFLDTDTILLAPLDAVPFDFDRPGASQRVEGTWPVIELYGPGYTAIWKSLYDRFGLDFASSLDLAQPDEYWRRYLYFNAGFFFHRCPRTFGGRFRDWAVSVRSDPPPELVCQPLDPWLDQIVLPLVIHSLGGGRDTIPPGLMDGAVTCHWRALPLFFARESDEAVAVMREIAAPNRVKKVLKEYEPFKHFLYQAKGETARAMFDRAQLPRDEATIRQKLRNRNLWVR